ncbi:hypothetical protein [Nocardioides marmotae]|uniref:Uncharacterized protein n=1 Tax=Nocardioides marmotae TaxID=2663857 RepID=A0A6I3J9Z0_9ACTN|nr:hypothetical protein [Nocardioides marmotae]MCR6031431.1 hypothetical protein [Gordonia jinghuaiqii]MBC9735436.1 hypothetical protein [Nocardioides marmotae]MTB86533.1 hypothetical protein [Nocardioides marmotae]MTB95070.1 hypothetical protein [Nocardioides marmotae]QKE02434.1 hypothetical protein HPC71_16195 [Nocardioides marmotae]
MSSSRRARPRHLASSPFKPEPELVLEVFEVDDRVSHDAHGLGRVIAVDSFCVTVNFGDRNIRVAPPFAKMSKL